MPSLFGSWRRVAAMDACREGISASRLFPDENFTSFGSARGPSLQLWKWSTGAKRFSDGGQGGEYSQKRTHGGAICTTHLARLSGERGLEVAADRDRE